MPKAVGLTKEEIRSKIQLKLKTQKEEDRKRKSRQIKNKLFKTRFFKKAKIVMFYVSFMGEVITKEMIQEARQLGKKVVVPVCEKDKIIRACLLEDNARMAKGPYGIPEPVNKKPVNLKNLDLVVVPGVAFTKDGSRLGRGKGYYDRFLKKLPDKAVSIGLAFGFQVKSSLPATPQDVSVNKVIFA
ncbi:MAG: 5-formyltetrahydrofolate cyclo-ligase [Candidatus Omnitrophica bacterium]|nr:5-formyltetrahydrofolate cyclo-ligase [Candidatus Omnitrophota bacterium]MBU1929007.1 5-formyltetrahydrofolate cyclo-ligase [Candidatus Omnitrophota bacterium]MBU2035677.1 5-formyltetrahydrofolate cyclo-ligase [Candidatus Omnitrophota bacterium]MBU2221090.1 5-formyltetrahydrofolate cyclo-ligase [Candidatus Omnitrophota bacterium]